MENSDIKFCKLYENFPLKAPVQFVISHSVYFSSIWPHIAVWATSESIDCPHVKPPIENE